MVWCRQTIHGARHTLDMNGFFQQMAVRTAPGGRISGARRCAGEACAITSSTGHWCHQGAATAVRRARAQGEAHDQPHRNLSLRRRHRLQRSPRASTRPTSRCAETRGHGIRAASTRANVTSWFNGGHPCILLKRGGSPALNGASANEGRRCRVEQSLSARRLRRHEQRLSSRTRRWGGTLGLRGGKMSNSAMSANAVYGCRRRHSDGRPPGGRCKFTNVTAASAAAAAAVSSRGGRRAGDSRRRIHDLSASCALLDRLDARDRRCGKRRSTPERSDFARYPSRPARAHRSRGALSASSSARAGSRHECTCAAAGGSAITAVGRRCAVARDGSMDPPTSPPPSAFPDGRRHPSSRRRRREVRTIPQRQPRAACSSTRHGRRGIKPRRSPRPGSVSVRYDGPESRSAASCFRAVSSAGGAGSLPTVAGVTTPSA